MTKYSNLVGLLVDRLNALEGLVSEYLNGKLKAEDFELRSMLVIGEIEQARAAIRAFHDAKEAK